MREVSLCPLGAPSAFNARHPRTSRAMPSVRITNLTPKPINVSLKQLTGQWLPAWTSAGDDRTNTAPSSPPSLPSVLPCWIQRFTSRSVVTQISRAIVSITI